MNTTDPMKVSNIECKLKYDISTMVIYGSYMYEFSVNKDMIFFNNDKRRKEVVVGKVEAHLCLTLIIKELKISVSMIGR